MNFSEWLSSLTTDTRNEIADKVGLPKRTLQYQIANGPKAETIIAIAQAYDTNPFRALVELGYAEPKWLTELNGDVEAALLAATEDQLAFQVLRRLKLAKGDTVFDDPIDEVADRRARHVDAPVRPRTTPNVLPLAQDQYVADSSPDEPEEGDDGYHDGP